MQTGELGTIAFVTDATADVPHVERAAESGIPWLVLDETYHASNGADLADNGESAPKLVQMVLDGELDPQPSEPGWDDFCEVYSRLREIDRVFSIHSPSRVSWAVERAREAAGAFPNVRVIEANVTGIGLGLLTSCARNFAATGAGPDAVEDWLRAHRESVRMLVVPDRFDPLDSQRGLTARLLNSQPMLQATATGGMKSSRRLRSRRATVAAIERYFEEHTTDAGELHLALAHGDAAGAIDPFLDLLERIRPGADVVMVGRVGPRLVHQLGSRCVAAAWIESTSAT